MRYVLADLHVVSFYLYVLYETMALHHTMGLLIGWFISSDAKLC